MPVSLGSIEYIIDGNQPLHAQQNQLNYAELAYEAQIVAYDSYPDGPTHANKAVFTKAQLPAVRPLELIQLGGDVALLVSNVIQQGRTIVFHSTLYVSGAASKVLGVR